MAPSPLSRTSQGSCRSLARTLLNCYSSGVVRRELCRCLSSGLTDSFTYTVVVSHVNLRCTIRDVVEISWKVLFWPYLVDVYLFCGGSGQMAL